MSTLFISDLHLHAERPELTQAFEQFIAQQATGADSLYILGDFFEAWVGDDDYHPTRERVTGALQQLAQQGTAIYLMHGNRDFLMGETFAAQCQAELLPEACVIQPYQQRLLIMHGDQLCLDDGDYQQFRAQVRDARWQQQFLEKSLSERHAIADAMRAGSRDAQQQKAQYITDVNNDEVMRTMAEQDVDLLIHGHTHRPDIHHHEQKTRIVLGDWEDYGWCLHWYPDDSYELKRFAIPPA